MFKKLIIVVSLFSTICIPQAIPITTMKAIQTATTNIQPSGTDLTKPQLYNRSTLPVNVYMYSGSAITTNGFHFTPDETNLLNPIAVVIPGGQSINLLNNARSIAVYYESKDPIVLNIQGSQSYIIAPSADKWSITPKLRTP